VAEVLAAPDAKVLNFSGTTGGGRLVSSTALGHSVLVLDGLPSLSPDRAYQLWFIEGGAPVGAGVFRLDDGRVVARTAELPANAQQVAVTEEPSSGSAAPTTPILLSASAS
jgi:anti-sigma-K factor RskA